MRGARPLLLFAAVTVAVVLAGCVSDQSAHLGTDPAGCLDLSAVQAQPGSFQYAGAVRCKTASESHEWTNPGPFAQVQWGGAVVLGTLELRVFDGLDRQVYEFTIDGTTAAGAQGVTDMGAPTAPPLAGTWRIDIEFSDFTGTMGLQLSSPP